MPSAVVGVFLPANSTMLIHLLPWFLSLTLPELSAENIFSQIRRMSFVSIPENSDFPLENLPYGIFSTADKVRTGHLNFRLILLWCYCIHFLLSNSLLFYIKIQVQPRIGVAIGEHILDLHEVAHLFDGPELKNNQHVLREVGYYSWHSLVVIKVLNIYSMTEYSEQFHGVRTKSLDWGKEDFTRSSVYWK